MGVTRTRQYLTGRALLDYAAPIHYGDSVRDARGDREAVRDEYNRQLALAAQAIE
jgi:hypothetical protein